MSNDYVTKILVDQRMADLRHEADQERVARLARRGQPQRRWWERLMLFRTHRDPSGRHQHRFVTLGGARG